MRAIILKPLINEKSMSLTKNDFYTFAIDLKATKEQVARVITEKFGVKVVSVRTVTLQPKKKQQKSRKGVYYTPKTKKALVQVQKGQKIALFEEATKEPEETVEVRTAEGEKMTEVKEKKSLLRGTKVRIEKMDPKLAGNKAKVEREETMNQAQSQKESSNEKGEK